MYTIISHTTNQSGIYKIMNKNNGKYYIGSSFNMRKRMREHLWGLRNGVHKNPHLQNAYIKNGEDSFVFSVLEDVEDLNELLEREQYHLDNFQAYDREIGYNISIEAGRVIKSEAQTRRGFTRSDEEKARISNTLKGHKVSKETRERISKSLEGKNLGAEHWAYGKKKSKEFRENHSMIMKGKFTGDKNPFYGKKHTIETRKKMGKPVVQLTEDGIKTNTFFSASEAERQNDMGRGLVSSVCVGKQKTAGGYKWMYLEEYEKTKATQ